MINQQLFNFVQQSLQRGSTKEKITSDLISGGWTPSDIEECFNAITSPASPATPVSISANDNVISQKVIETIPSISFLKIKRKKIIKWAIFIALVCFLIILKFAFYTPVLETCAETNILAYDAISGDSIKYVQCLKGYKVHNFPDGGYNLYSQTTSGYVVSHKNENTISNVFLKENGNSNLGFNKYADIYFADKGLFVSAKTNSSDGHYAPNDELYFFNNSKLEKVGPVSFYSEDIIAYDDNEIYYYHQNLNDVNSNNTKIYKYNLLTRESSQVIDLSSIKRDKSYDNIYNFCPYKQNDSMMATFDIVTSVDKKTQEQKMEYYLLNLKSKELIKIGFNGGYIVNENCDSSGSKKLFPPKAKYSIISGVTAKSYGLDYGSNQYMFISNFLKIFKKGVYESL